MPQKFNNAPFPGPFKTGIHWEEGIINGQAIEPGKFLLGIVPGKPIVFFSITQPVPPV